MLKFVKYLGTGLALTLGMAVFVTGLIWLLEHAFWFGPLLLSLLAGAFCYVLGRLFYE